MRKQGFILLLCICMAIGITGCGSKNKENSESEVVPQENKEEVVIAPSDSIIEEPISEAAKSESEVKETEESPTVTLESSNSKVEEPTEPAVDIPWEMVTELKYDFNVYDAMFYSEEDAITVGYAGEIHTSKDGGVTWPKSENQSLCRFGLDVVDKSICYTCGNGGDITKSVDGGKTFTSMTKFGQNEPNQCIMMSFLDENTGIVAAKTYMAITKDGAKSWTPIEITATAIAIYMETANQFSYIGDDLTLYQTTDGGTTWNAIPLNLPEKDDYINLKKDFAFTSEEDGSYTIYCFQKSTKSLKSYTTTDLCVTYVENPMPETSNIGYLHMKGNILTICNTLGKTITAFVKR